MTIKIEDATANRPDGHRLIDAPVVTVDLLDFTWKLKNETAWEKNDRNAITVFKSGGVTMLVTALHKGAAINDLRAHGLLSIQVLEGEISISSNKGDALLKEKQMIIIHPEEEQMLTAEEDAVLLLTSIKTEQEVTGSL
jgi:quercetin dioxygenase-like cupin family protein